MVLLTLWIITPSAYLISGVIRRLVILSLGIFLVLTFRVFNPLLFYLTFETTLIPITLLILGWGYQPERIIAAKYILLYTLFGSLPLLLILILSTQFTTIFSPVIIKITLVRPLFLVMAFLIKLPMYGAHLWLPKAHVEAPVIGRVLLAAILLKMGVYGIWRIKCLFPVAMHHLSLPVLVWGLWGGAAARLLCAQQQDYKALIAYSSVAHMALLLAALLSNVHISLKAAFFLGIAHGFRSALLFMLAHWTYTVYKTRALILTGGLVGLTPLVTALWFGGVAINIGAPPTPNFFAEAYCLFTLIKNTPLIWLPYMSLPFMARVYSLTLYNQLTHGRVNLSLAPCSLPQIAHIRLLFYFLPGVLWVANITVL